MRETEKNVCWLRDINPRAFFWWAGRRDKIYSPLVFQEVAQLMNYDWIKSTKLNMKISFSV